MFFSIDSNQVKQSKISNQQCISWRQVWWLCKQGLKDAWFIAYTSVFVPILGTLLFTINLIDFKYPQEDFLLVSVTTILIIYLGSTAETLGSLSGYLTIYTLPLSSKTIAISQTMFAIIQILLRIVLFVGVLWIDSFFCDNPIVANLSIIDCGLLSIFWFGYALLMTSSVMFASGHVNLRPKWWFRFYEAIVDVAILIIHLGIYYWLFMGQTHNIFSRSLALMHQYSWAPFFSLTVGLLAIYLWNRIYSHRLATQDFV